MQLKWLTTAAAGVAVAYAAAILVSLQVEWGSPTTPTWIAAVQNAAVVTFILIPIAIGIAILKYRLYDIDVVINKTVVYGALAGFITLVYVGIVVGIGTVIGQGDRPNLGLSILATAVVAVAFQPVRERVQRFANRLVYGKRATPYEVLSHFASRMAGTYATDDLMPQMARVLAEGTGAATAKVWLRVARELRVTSVWPEVDGAGFERIELPGGELPPIFNADLAIPVRDRGELLGALSITKGRGEPVTPTEQKLLTDLASQAGLVLRNVRLIEELRASRQRIVSAQDEERRRIERNIHDGAQQQLVALNVKLGLARTLADKDLAKTEELISQLQSETQDALENLRDLARGIYPPLLADKGLVAALEAQARKATFPVTVQADGVGRFSKETEAAVYFCVLEAMQNVAKYAQASNVMVRLFGLGGELNFQVEDDGRGFDPEATRRGSGLTNMTDRIEALGGTLEIQSHPGRGTTLVGSVPIREIQRETVPERVG
jgi:signal transduction histidine kinase